MICFASSLLLLFWILAALAEVTRVERMKDRGRGIPFGGYVAPRGAMKNLEHLKKKGLLP